jgi:hypothetical protein
MIYLNISFEERAKLSAIISAKQPLVTLKEAREQAQWLKRNSIKKKKQRNRCEELCR